MTRGTDSRTISGLNSTRAPGPKGQNGRIRSGCSQMSRLTADRIMRYPVVRVIAAHGATTYHCNILEVSNRVVFLRGALVARYFSGRPLYRGEPSISGGVISTSVFPRTGNYGLAPPAQSSPKR